MNVNEYLHNTSDISDRFQKHIFVRNTNISDTDTIKTRQVHLHCEDIHSHAYLFYIRVLVTNVLKPR